MSNSEGPATFHASVWTDVAGLAGTQLSNAFWSLATTVEFGTCCDLVTIGGISGVTVNGGAAYFLIVAPANPADSSSNAWDWNTQGASGRLGSDDGGVNWVDTGNSLGAFEIQGDAILEPGSWLLPATGLALGLAAVRGQSDGAK